VEPARRDRLCVGSGRYQQQQRRNHAHHVATELTPAGAFRWSG
jgi:hypothetical protein